MVMMMMMLTMLMTVMMLVMIDVLMMMMIIRMFDNPDAIADCGDDSVDMYVSDSYRVLIHKHYKVMIMMFSMMKPMLRSYILAYRSIPFL